MSGHSKWSTIKHKKGALDAKKGKLFTKLSKEIIVAARDGGGESESNFKLRLAIQNAKDANMPNENIERSIAKGSGKETGGSSLEEITYEAYGPGGSALLIQALTDGPMLLCFLIFVWIKPQRAGVVGCCFLIFYGLFRFLTEFVRQPDEGVALLFGFSRGQQLSFLMIICGIACLVLVRKTQKSFFGGLIKRIPTPPPNQQ